MSTETSGRLASLDQFRGYTMAGMLLVNFLGGFAIVHPLLKHHNTYCSYADTIMPQFFFAVGFAFRLTLLRRLDRGDRRGIYRRLARRVLGLALIGLVIYHLDERLLRWREIREAGLGALLATSFKRDFFQTLTHIAVTSLWVAPVMAARPRVRIAFCLASASLHVLLSHLFNFHWVWSAPRAIDGGPLGFLTWTIPVLVGSFAYDAVAEAGRRAPVGRLARWAALLMLAGYGLSLPSTLYAVPSEAAGGADAHPRGRLAASPVVPPLAAFEERSLAALVPEPPFRPPPPPGERRINYWMMSQRAGTVSYHTFAAGFALAVYALFLALADVRGLEIGVFRTLGRNSLVAYLLDGLLAKAVRPLAPSDSPLWYALVAFAAFAGAVYLVVRHLERRGIFLRI